VNAGALGEIVDIQAAYRDIRAGDRQAVAAVGLAAAQLDQRRASVAGLRSAVDQDRITERCIKKEYPRAL
jgi:hypothetical protein